MVAVGVLVRAGAGGVLEHFAFQFADELLDPPAGDLGGGGVDEGRAALSIQTVNALTGRVQDRLVTALELLDFLTTDLNVHLEHVLRALEFLGLLGHRAFGLPAVVELLEHLFVRAAKLGGAFGDALFDVLGQLPHLLFGAPSLGGLALDVGRQFLDPLVQLLELEQAPLNPPHAQMPPPEAADGHDHDETCGSDRRGHGKLLHPSVHVSDQEGNRLIGLHGVRGARRRGFFFSQFAQGASPLQVNVTAANEGQNQDKRGANQHNPGGRRLALGHRTQTVVAQDCSTAHETTIGGAFPTLECR